MKNVIVTFTFTTLLLINFSGNAKSIEKSSNKALISTHNVISSRYKAVPHLKARDVNKMDKGSYVIFDVREKGEYAVSHIEDAIWVDPSIDTATFYEKFSDVITDKTLILYCSVGARSTKLAAKLLDDREDELNIYNLENGIFGWHNESRPLFQAAKSTEFVHPYNRIWGRMVNRKELKRYKTENDSEN